MNASSGQLIKTTNFENHFLMNLIPFGTKKVLCQNSVNSTYSFNLPITITSTNNEMWKIDTYIYGLGMDDPTSSFTYDFEQPNLMTLKLSLTNNKGISIIYSGVGTEHFIKNGGDTNHNPYNYRHDQVIIDFQAKLRAGYPIEGALWGFPAFQYRIGSGFSSSSTTTTGDFIKIVLSGLGNSTIKNISIFGLIVEFTKIRPYDIGSSIIL